MNDLDLCFIVSHLQLNISENVRDRSLVPMVYQLEMA